MAKQVQVRRGTSAEVAAFTGAVGELSVDTDLDTIFVHDGATQGGIRLAKHSEVAAGSTDLTSFSVVTGSASAAGALNYNNTTGVFTFSPADVFTDADVTAHLNGQIATTLTPATTNTYDIGSPTFKFKDLYLGDGNLYLGTNTVTIAAGKLQLNGANIATESYSDSAASTLSGMTDVDLTGAFNGGVLSYNGTSWVATAIDGTYFVDLSSTVTTLTPNGGGRADFLPSIVADTKFQIDSDADIYVSEGQTSGNTGWRTDHEGPMLRTLTADFLEETLVNVGTNDFSVEAWIEIEGASTNNNILISWGSSPGKLFTLYTSALNGHLYCGSYMTDDAGTAFKSYGMAEVSSVDVGAGKLLHVVVNVNRGSSLAAGSLEWWVNGHLVRVETYTEPASPPSYSPSDFTSGTFALAGSVNANPDWKGSIFDVKIYKRLLTMDECENHCKKGFGPTVNYLDTTPTSLVFWLDFVNGDGNTWTNASYPDARISDLRFTSGAESGLTQLDYIGIRTGAPIATEADYRIRAGKPEIVRIPANSNINILSNLATKANIKIVEVNS